MPALVKDRLYKRRQGLEFAAPVAAGAICFEGGIVCLSAAGYAVPGATLATLRAVGIAQKRADNTGGGNGAVTVPYERGTFNFANDPADPVTPADIGATVFMTDDNTVSRTNPGGNTKSAAGLLLNVDANAAWVKI